LGAIVRVLPRILFAIVVFNGSLGAGTVAHAAGAIAVGQCDRYGYFYGAGSAAAAAGRALAICRRNGDATCHVVVTLRRRCGAFAVSGPNGCGGRGWAYAGSRVAAEAIALASCRKYGGSNCRIQAWVCDAGP
jgi:hypothetical protein